MGRASFYRRAIYGLVPRSAARGMSGRQPSASISRAPATSPLSMRWVTCNSNPSGIATERCSMTAFKPIDAGLLGANKSRGRDLVQGRVSE